MITSDFLDTGHGGVETHVFSLATALAHEGHNVTIFRASSRPITGVVPALHERVSYTALSGARISSRRMSAILRAGGQLGLALELLRRMVSGLCAGRYVDRFLRECEDADVVHQHDFLESWGLGHALARRGVPVVWTNHLGEFLYMRSLPGGRTILRYLTRHYRQTIAPSSELADRGAISISPRMIPNGVEVQHFRPVSGREERQQIRESLGWTEERVIIVPRRWAPTKGVVFAAEAMTAPMWPKDARTVFVGSGTREYPGYAARILKFLHASGSRYEIHERVDRSDMALMLRAADVCLIPSVKEATSLSALESMASGTIVVAANVGGIPEIIEEGVTGYLHLAESPEGIATAVVMAVRNGERDHVAANALTMVRQHYTWTGIAERTCAVYEMART